MIACAIFSLVLTSQRYLLPEMAKSLACMMPLTLDEDGSVGSYYSGGMVRTYDMSKGTEPKLIQFGLVPYGNTWRVETQRARYSLPPESLEYARVSGFLSKNRILVVHGSTKKAGVNAGILEVGLTEKRYDGKVLAYFKLNGIFQYGGIGFSLQNTSQVAIGERSKGGSARFHLFSRSDSKILRISTPKHLTNLTLPKGGYICGFDYRNLIGYATDAVSTVKVYSKDGTRTVNFPPVPKTQSWSVNTVGGTLYASTFPKSGEVHLPLLVKLLPNGQWQRVGKLSLVGYSPSGKVILVKEPDGRVRRL